VRLVGVGVAREGVGRVGEATNVETNEEG